MCLCSRTRHRLKEWLDLLICTGFLSLYRSPWRSETSSFPFVCMDPAPVRKCGNGRVTFVQVGMYPSIVIKKSLIVSFNVILNHNTFIYLERSFSCTLTYFLNINADVLNRKPMVVFTIKEISKLFSLLVVSDVGFPIALSRSTDVLEFFNNSFLSVFFYRFSSHRPVLYTRRNCPSANDLFAKLAELSVHLKSREHIMYRLHHICLHLKSQLGLSLILAIR